MFENKITKSNTLSFTLGSLLTAGVVAFLAHRYETEIFNHLLRKLPENRVMADRHSNIKVIYTEYPGSVKLVAE